MVTIVVFGGTGYTGHNIVREAASRGHHVVSVSRSQPRDPVGGVRYEAGAAEELAEQVIPGADAAGGFSSLRPAPGQPRLAEGEVAEQFRAEALEGETTRRMLAEKAPAHLDWVFVSPAGAYGAWAAGERTGTYRVGGEVALFDAEGGSAVSGADFALAVVDEIESPAHHREHIGVAY